MAHITNKDALDLIAVAETRRFLRSKDMRFLECAIELMLTDYHPDEVAEILEQQAQMLRDYG